MDMVERVARASFEFWRTHVPGGKGDIEFEPRPKNMAHARAIIEAMREPTVEMTRNGAIFDPAASKLEDYNRAKSNAAISWRTMIDTALKDGE